MLRLNRDVRITPLCLEHAANMHRWMCDPEVSRNIGLRSEPSMEKTEAWIKSALDDQSIYPFAILLKEQHVGNVVLDRMDEYLGSARLSIYIGEASARQSGVGLTAIYQIGSEAFKQKSLHKIWLTVHSRNFAAINTYTRLGFMLEGIMRDEFWLDGARAAALYMGLLRDDFARLNVE